MQTTTGCFPVLGSNLTTTGRTTEYRRAGNSYTTNAFETGSNSDFLYRNVLNGLFNHTERVRTWFPGYNYFGAYGIRTVGEPSFVPPNKLLEGPKIRNKHPRFNKAVREYSMVVSDYSNVTAMLSYRNGGNKVVISSFQNSDFESTRSPVASGFSNPDRWFQFAHGCWSLRPESEAVSTYFSYPYEEISITDELNPYHVGWDDQVIQNFLNSFSIPSDKISQLVLKNTANANTGTVDILTTIAELPEAARMVLNGMSALRKLFSDIKKKKLRLADQAKKVKFEAEEKIFRINYASRQEYLAARNERSKRLIEKKRLQEVQHVKDNTKKFLADLATAAAQVELTTRYGILPIVYTIEGFIETYENLDMIFKRWSEKSLYEIEFPDVPGFTKTGTVMVSLRAFIKRKFDQVSEALAPLKHFTASLVRTAWELVPLSFVVDWFINVGDILSTFYGSTLSGYTEAAAISLKIENATCTYLHEESGATVKVDVKGYMRKVINPSDYCRLIWSPDVSGYRQYDAASLIWLQTKKLLKSL